MERERGEQDDLQDEIMCPVAQTFVGILMVSMYFYMYRSTLLTDIAVYTSHQYKYKYK